MVMRAFVGVGVGAALPTVVSLGVEARLDFGTFDLGTRYAWLGEDFEGGLEVATYGRTELGFKVIDLETFNLRVRGGIQHWVAGGVHDLGVSGGIAVEAFPGSSVTVNAEVGAGNLGGARIVYGRALVGTMLGHLELSGGWDHTTFLTSDGSPSVHLSGPVLLARYWF